ncbi:PRC-barrel domain containing protein [Deinococcus detaillensis]|uniref:PRC-barrel domain containing protein n=1 Tax=Deinococcus detaillensis TaxID=2592048 RepID=A0A553UNI8_9DEIO|nr:PRC-barrel domain-containing protein [Deinococcus detaillensis]TSA81772.1 PRC-barrel domain containing protein [Deinococcus detaillensis]
MTTPVTPGINTASPHPAADHIALVKLGDTDLTLLDPTQDLRHRAVTDSAGKAIGHVSALFIDRQDRKVRFLQVSAGGFLGLGERAFLVPVEDITSLAPLKVHLGQTLDTVKSAPLYDPVLSNWHDAAFWNAYYLHYGYPSMSWPGY